MSPKPLKLVAKVVITDKKGRFLLLKRSMSSRNDPGEWDLPGGKIAAWENFDEGLIREVAEETGVRISLGHAIGIAESESASAKVVYLIFQGIQDSGHVRLSSEHDDYIWAAPSELQTLDLSKQFRPFLKTHFGDKSKA